MIKVTFIEHVTTDEDAGFVLDVRGHAKLQVCSAVTALVKSLSMALAEIAKEYPGQLSYQHPRWTTKKRRTSR